VDPFIGEIRMFAGNFAPQGWALCSGQILPISQNEALYSLIGTQYGGDGQSTFGLPDLRSRVPVHQGPNFIIGSPAGAETVSLTADQLPQHTHTLQGSTDAATGTQPHDAALAVSSGATITPYGSDRPYTTLAPTSISTVGGRFPHDNLQPYLCINFIIALEGIYPSQN